MMKGYGSLGSIKETEDQPTASQSARPPSVRLSRSPSDTSSSSFDWSDDPLTNPQVAALRRKLGMPLGPRENAPLLQEMVGRTRSNQSRTSTPHGSDMQMDEGTTNFDELMENLNEYERDTGERLRRHLQFFFMNPMDKWKVRRQFPFKLVLQVLKIVFVTVQLIIFADLRRAHVDFLEDTTTVMRHKFLKGWDDERDSLAYPPNTGLYSAYSGAEIFERLQHIITQYYGMATDSFSPFSYDVQNVHSSRHARDTNVSLLSGIGFNQIPFQEACMERIANVTVLNNTYEFDVREVKECIKLNFTEAEVNEISKDDDTSSLQDALKARGITFQAEDALRISKATIRFNFRTIHFTTSPGSDHRPECYKIGVEIIFDNSMHTGQVHIYLSTTITYSNKCNGRIIKGEMAWDTIVMGVLDIFVLLISIASLVLCMRALIKAHLLKNRCEEFFENALKMKLSFSDRLDFLNLWYVMIVVNDICIIMGTTSKFSIEFKDFDSDLFTLTGILLGIGALLVYAGVLRYFGFFSQYNILILTIKKAMPNILRFMVCAAVLYCGFLIAGWVIIGPYSMKFRTLSASSEALFSLLNGDDMFATFYTINDSNSTIKIFGTIYIYLFVSLFIYIVLSLFIAIILDAYEIVKDRYVERLMLERSLLKDFVQAAPVPELSSPSTRAQFAPSSLLNLGRGWQQLS